MENITRILILSLVLYMGSDVTMLILGLIGHETGVVIGKLIGLLKENR